MLKSVNLHKSFGKRHIVRGVTIQVEPGRIVGLLGPNGAGKTTCFYMIVGLISVGDGQIFVDDIDVTHEPVNVPRRTRRGLSATGCINIPQTERCR